MRSIVEALAPGDILSHIYHGGQNDCTADGYAAFRLAREKGVILDAAFAGHVHTDFVVLRNAFAAGYFPDTISTDITVSSAFKRGGRYGMTTCMSMARTAGMAEEAILKASTTAPAAALGQIWGTLREGGTADLAVLDYTDEPFSFTDRAGNTLASEKGYRCRMTIANGVIVYRD
jgi:dihydroorotase